MADCFIKDTSLLAIANAIREKNGKDESWKIAPKDMPEAINRDLGNAKGFIERTLDEIENDNVLSIGPYAFYNYTSLSRASMSACTQIGEQAFAGCVNLLEAVFPECIEIGNNAYNGCINLSEALFPKCTDVKVDSFNGCSNLASVDFQACKSMSVSTFASCPNITYMALGFDQITNANIPLTSTAKKKILGFTFPNCISIGAQTCYCEDGKYANLQKIDAPVCEYIGQAAFARCTNLKDGVKIPKCKTIGVNAFLGCTGLSIVSYSECTSISSTAFQGCTGLEKVFFPECTSVHVSAFSGCKNIQEAAIGLEEYRTYITSSNSKANIFRSASSALTDLTLTKCSSIGSTAFQSYTGLKNVNAPMCTYIDDFAFYNCTSLTSISFPACSFIGSSVFQGCGAIESINLPSCANIWHHAFADCTSLSIVDISVQTHIHASAFYGCTNLINLTLTGSSVSQLEGIDAFGNTPITVPDETDGSYGAIYVPAHLLESYHVAPYWSDIKDRIFAIADIMSEEDLISSE
jgi:hypothetical protein